MLEFSGQATTYGNIDSDNDIIEPGAFGTDVKTVPLRYNHGTSDDAIIGEATLIPHEKGIGFKATVDDSNPESLQGQVAKLIRGENLTKVSIGFYESPVARKSNEDGTNTITSGDICELSVVGIPANGKAIIENYKSANVQHNIKNCGTIDLLNVKGSNDMDEQSLKDMLQEIVKEQLANQDAVEEVESTTTTTEEVKAEDTTTTTTEEAVETTTTTTEEVKAEEPAETTTTTTEKEEEVMKSFEDYANSKDGKSAFLEIIAGGEVKSMGDALDAFIEQAPSDVNAKGISGLAGLPVEIYEDVEFWFNNSVLWSKVNKINVQGQLTQYVRHLEVARIANKLNSGARMASRGVEKKDQDLEFEDVKFTPANYYKKQMIYTEDIQANPGLLNAIVKELSAYLIETLEEAIIFGMKKEQMDKSTDAQALQPVVAAKPVGGVNLVDTYEVDPAVPADVYLAVKKALKGLKLDGELVVFGSDELVEALDAQEVAYAPAPLKLPRLKSQDDIITDTIWFNERAKEEGILAVGIVPKGYAVATESSINMLQRTEIDINAEKARAEILAGGALDRYHSAFVIKAKA